MEDINEVIDPENWTTTELFEYCQLLNIISSEDRFEDWMNDRTDLLWLVRNDIQNNIKNIEL